VTRLRAVAALAAGDAPLAAVLCQHAPPLRTTAAAAAAAAVPTQPAVQLSAVQQQHCGAIVAQSRSALAGGSAVIATAGHTNDQSNGQAKGLAALLALEQAFSGACGGTLVAGQQQYQWLHAFLSDVILLLQ
jgi:hypothetical protein